MRPHLVPIMFLICLAGCAAGGTKPVSAYGNFVTGAPPAHEKQLADDAARQLSLLYPPASTRLDLQQGATDGFGRQLVDLLRSQGYALRETPTAERTPPAGNATLATPAANNSDDSVGIAFDYVVDAVASPRLYRVTLILGSQTISRAYVPQGEALHPAGAWVRKE